MFKDLTKVLSADILAQLLLLLSLPILSRLYSPEDFGHFALTTSIAWILVVLFTGKLELLTITMSDDIKARDFVVALSSLVFFLSFLAFIFIFLFFDLFKFHGIDDTFKYYSIILLTIVYSLNEILKSYANFLGNFALIAKVALLNSIILVFFAIIYPIFYEDDLYIGLILSVILGQFFSLVVYSNRTKLIKNLSHKFSFDKALITLKGIYRKGLLVFSNQSFLSITLNLPILIISNTSPVNTGNFSMSERIIGKPTSVIGQSISQALKYHYKESINPFLAKNLIRKSILVSLLISIFAYGSFALIFPKLVPFILGSNWIEITPILQWVIAIEALNFLYYVHQDILIIKDHMKSRFFGQFFQMIFTVSLLITSVYLEMDIYLILALIFIVRAITISFDIYQTWIRG